MATNIKSLRKKRGMTLRGLAEKVGVTAQCISNYESGIRIVDLPTAAKIAAALNCTVDDLIEKETA